MGLAQAKRYLLDARSPAGYWYDFDTLAGHSDEWVTAYVATHLAGLTDKEAINAAKHAQHWLHRRRWFSKGWGYNGRVPVDVDSTVWVLHLGARLGLNSRRLEKARQFVELSALSNGGLPTYPRSCPIRRFTKTGNLSFDGWCQAHTCVTANAVPILKDATAARAFLRKMQLPDGSWPAYWWVDREYSTAAAVACLKQNATQEDDEYIERAVMWAVSRLSLTGAVRTLLHPEGSPFATALCLVILYHSFDRKVLSKQFEAIEWLLSNQRSDGSWLPSADLRIPPPYELNPDDRKRWTIYGRGAGTILHDQRRIFTTATVMAALA